MSGYDFDLFVIGGGSGGVRAARLTAGMGFKVGLAEASRMGGTCVIRGCVPKKLYVYASRFAEDFEFAPSFGWTLDGARFDWATLQQNKNAEIARLEGLYTKGVEGAGAKVFHEYASFADAHTIRLSGGRTVTADKILIAAGGHPVRDLDGAPGAEFCSLSDEVFEWPQLPKRIVVAGGGYIAVEFAHVFHALGAEVTVVIRAPKVLRGFDEDLRDGLMASMQSRGLTVLAERHFASVTRDGDGLVAELTSGERLAADKVLLAWGRKPSTGCLDLANAGLAAEPDGRLAVDDYSRTAAANIFAVGDVTERLPLTPVAIHEAMCFVKTAFQDTPTKPDHTLVPTAVFTTPEIGTVGLSEAQALAAGHAIDVYKSIFRPMKFTLAGRGDRMMMKLIVDAATGKVLGCHLFGPDASEIVQVAAVAMKMGATKADFDATVALHPSAAEELVTMRTKSYSKAP
jgi:glutathione reductase (NADPH)